MVDKLDFYRWFNAVEEYNANISTKWIENYVHNTGWQSIKTGEAIHDGDCTDMVYTCGLCMITDLLVAYREYYFNEKTIEEYTEEW